MTYTIYSLATGQILRIAFTTNIEAQIQDGEGYLDGSIDDSAYYIENNLPVEIPVKPSQYSVFDFVTKQWVQNQNMAILDVSEKRKRLLNASDWTQLPDVSITTKQAWAQYRQALRDITSQEGYPFNVIWPQNPNEMR